VTKYKPIITTVLFLFLIVLGILIWRALLLFNNLISLSPEVETNSEVKPTSKTVEYKKIINLNLVTQTANENLDHYETIEETISRLKRDVKITGTIVGTAGEESAIFQIEGMPDRSFNINTQLMDGFIITKISPSQVVLKNQTGDESFILQVQSGSLVKSMVPDTLEPTPMEPNTHEPGTLQPDDYEPRPMEPETFNPITVNPNTYEPGTFQPDDYEPRPMEPETFNHITVNPNTYEPGTFQPDD
jgi:hypothetical protein